MTEPLRFRVGLVVRHRVFRDALRALLEATGVILAVGEASDVSDVMQMLDAYRPDAVLLCLDGTGPRELALLHRLRDIADRSHPLIMTSDVDVALHAQVIEMGAKGIVLMEDPGAALAKAVQKICAGEIWLDRARTAGVLNHITRRRPEDDPEAVRIDSLTAREREIVTLVTEGLTNRQIAERLFISEATARNHLTSILDKLDVTDRFQLAVYAFRRGLVICPQTPAMLRTAARMADGGRHSSRHEHHPGKPPRPEGTVR